MTLARADIERERDVEQLRRIALAQHVAIEQLAQALAEKHGPAAVQEALDLATGAAQSAKTGTGETAAGSRAPRERKKRERFGPTDQPALIREERIYVLDTADRACTSCGGELHEMEGQFETAEMIDVVDVEYRVVVTKRQKYACKCGSCVETALGPEHAIAGGRYSLAFAIKVAIDKYLDHIPLTRQERILRRHGLDVTTQTLWDQVNAVARRLDVLDAALLARVLAQPVIGLDQTSWPRLEADAKKPWQMWCLSAPGVVVHRIRDDKGAATFTALLGDYHGTVVCDALATHAAGARDGPGIVLGGCWAHVFRKFEEARPNHPEAGAATKWIGMLYEIDEEAGDDLVRRAELRTTRSRAVLGEMKDWLWSQATLKTLAIGKAATYTVANWDRLTRFLDDARVPLDNNATERAFRGPVVGRKNHYGSKSRRGTEVAATLYSVLETAKLHAVDPAEYLHAAILAGDDGRVLTPWDFAAAAR